MSVPEEWADRARYDFETAKDMLAAGRHVYVVLCCQQAVEKALKALIAERTGNLPRRSHDLMKLAADAGIDVPQPRGDQLRALTTGYVESRYPAPSSPTAAVPDRSYAEEVFAFTEELLRWLSTFNRE